MIDAAIMPVVMPWRSAGPSTSGLAELFRQWEARRQRHG
jgi:hypothetical protein